MHELVRKLLVSSAALSALIAPVAASALPAQAAPAVQTVQAAPATADALLQTTCAYKVLAGKSSQAKVCVNWAHSQNAQGAYVSRPYLDAALADGLITTSRSWAKGSSVYQINDTNHTGSDWWDDNFTSWGWSVNCIDNTTASNSYRVDFRVAWPGQAYATMTVYLPCRV